MKKVVSYVPLVIITGLSIYSMCIVATSNIIFSYEHYIGIVLILISWLLLIHSIKISKLSTLVTLLAGVFSQAAFTPVISRYRIGFTIEGIGFDILIQAYCLFLIVLFIILNWSFLKVVIKRKNVSSDLI